MRNRVRLSKWFCAVVCVAVVLAAGDSWSAPMSPQTVRNAVQTWVREVTANARPDAVIERLDPHVVNGRVTAYVAQLSSGGFCICGGDDLVLPVYLYNSTGIFDPSVPTHQFILQEITERVLGLQAELDSGVAAHQGALEERRNLWAGLASGRAEAARAAASDQATPVSLVLPLTTKWDQGAPYNDSCPTGVHSCNRAITGCVATAAAQVMNYWKWPPTGSGAVSYYYKYRWADSCVYKYYSPDSYHPLTIPNNAFWNTHLTYSSSKLAMCGCWDESVYRAADNLCDDLDYWVALMDLYDAMHKDSVVIWRVYDATAYNWSLMKDVHPATAAGDAELAKVMMDVGAAAELAYGMLLTGGYYVDSTSKRDLQQALRDNFRYDSDIIGNTGRSAGDLDSIITDLQWFRPVLLAGYDSNGGGHAWVAVGYNTGTYPATLLMNYGWSGGSDGWYTLDTCLFPQDMERLSFIAPNAGVTFVGNPWLGDGTPNNPMNTLDVALGVVPNGTTLILKAASSHTVAGGIITKPISIKGTQVSIFKP